MRVKQIAGGQRRSRSSPTVIVQKNTREGTRRKPSSKKVHSSQPAIRNAVTMRPGQARTSRAAVPAQPRGLRLAKRKGSPCWWIYGSWRGLRVRKSTFETDFGRAQVELIKAIIAIQNEFDQVGKPKKRTVSEAFDGYLAATVRSLQTKRAIERIRCFIDSTLYCDQVNAALLHQLRSKVLRPDARDQTFKRQLVTPVKAALGWAAVNWGASEGCTIPAFPRIRNGGRRTVILMPHQAEQLIKLASSRGMHCLAAVVQFGLCEAPRRGEIYGLYWQFVDEARRKATLRDVKDMPGVVRDRLINELRPRTVAMLKSLRKENQMMGAVFETDDGSPYPSLVAFGRILNEQLRVVLKQMAFPDAFTLHNLRHTAASWWYSVNPDPERLRVLGGWKSLPMAMRYVHLVSTDMAAEVRKFWGLGSN
jgi:integrase